MPSYRPVYTVELTYDRVGLPGVGAGAGVRAPHAAKLVRDVACADFFDDTGTLHVARWRDFLGRLLADARA